MRSAIAVVLFCATTALAQPYLVKDIRTIGSPYGSSDPHGFVTLGSSLYFISSGRDSRGVWRLETPTSAPTKVFADTVSAITPFGGQLLIAPYSGLAITDGSSEPVTLFSGVSASGPLLETNGHVVFVGNANELWTTDGTTAGTMKIDLRPGSYALKVALLGTFGGRVVFLSDYGVGITDGTAAGTTTLTPLVSRAGRIVVSGDRFFFAGAGSGPFSGELWVSDGTAAGTHITKKTSEYGSLSNTGVAIAAISGNRVVYWPNYTNRAAMWVSDGSEAGTIPVANVFNVSGTTILNGVVYFAGSEQSAAKGVVLWRTDGTSAGTKAVGALPDDYLVSISTALGRIWATTAGSTGTHLSVSDGTSVRVLTDTGGSEVASFLGRIYFAGGDVAHGSELWSSDGTPEGTGLTADIEPDIAPSSYAWPIAASATNVLFTAIDDSNTKQLWSSDGTPEDTGIFPFAFSGGVRFGDFLYFTPDDKKTDLYRTDGTAAGTRKIYTFAKDAMPVAATKDLLYIDSGGSVWGTDGTTAGTAIAATDASIPPGSFNLAGRIMWDDSYGQLYEFDGHRKRLIATNLGFSMTPAGGRIFSVLNESNVTKLLFTDGTVDGVRQVATFPRYGTPYPLGAIGDRLLFAADDGSHGYELWSTDGTPEGTRLVRDIRPGPQGSIPAQFAVVGDRVLFIADDGTFGLRIWSSDGTAAGTVMLPVMSYGTPTIAKGLAFFAANDALHGTELWQTDGTADGTRLVADIYAGPSASSPGSMQVTRDALFFDATTLETGSELWALPLPGRTIAIDDARAPHGTTTATMTISLDAPSWQPVTATWSSTTGAAGKLAFGPGQTTKTITFAITPDPNSQLNRFDYVRLTDVRGAIATKSFGTVIEEGAPPSADLSLSMGSIVSNWQRSIIVTNHGPNTVPISTITSLASTSMPSTPYTTTVPSVAPGASVSVPFSINGFFMATVSSPTPDPDPTNNTLLAVGAQAWPGLTISLAPAVLQTGAHATLSIGWSGPVSLTSSDPSVMTVPATARAGDIDVVALAPGHTTITVSVGSLSGSIEVGVIAPGGTYRWPAQMTFTLDGDFTFGAPLRLTAKISSFAWDANAGPTGAVTFYDGDTAIAVGYVDQNAVAEARFDALTIGTHTIKAVYAGDAHFLGTATAPQSVTILKPAPITFFGTYDPLSDTTAEITIIARAPYLRPPSGTITLKNFQEVLAADVPFVGGIARVTTKRLNFVTIFYSGDAAYEPAIISVTLSPAAHRAAR